MQEQARQTVQALSELQQAVLGQELRVSQLRRTLTADHPQLRAAVAELEAQRAQLRRMTRGGQGSGVLIPLGASAELKLGAARVTREYARNEQIYMGLMAALAEAQMEGGDLPTVGVLDAPKRPVEPTRGPVAVIVIAAGVAGLLLGLLLALAREYGSRIGRDPEHGALAAAWEGFRGDLGALVGRRRPRRAAAE
jgi:capsule polysaccharide export protein KpsE/RkpR